MGEKEREGVVYWYSIEYPLHLKEGGADGRREREGGRERERERARECMCERERIRKRGCETNLNSEYA